MRSGGQVIVDNLVRRGVEVAFGVPGESFLDVLDAAYDLRPQFRFISCRHEAAAANMATAYGKLTGRPGVCLVSRGPGAAHAAIGVHIASQDCVPMVLLVGQVPRAHLGRDSFQEIDYRAVFGSMARWVGQPASCTDLPELVDRAFHYALSGRPGPVVLSLPEDVLSEQSDVQDVDPSTPAAFKPSDASLREINKLLETAERPLLVVGGPNWTESAAQRLRQVCERCSLPVVAAFRSQDVVDNRSSIYAGSVGVGGTPGLAESMGASDLLIAVGTRLDEVTAGAYSTIAAPVPRQRLVHVFPDPLEIGRVFKPILAIACAPEQFITAWASNRVPARDRRWASGLHAAYLRGLDGSGPGAVDLAAIVRYLSEALPEDAIITNGAGNYTAWVHRYYQFKRLNTQLAPVAGAMGFGVPAAIAAKLIHPNRTVVSFAGDGCFLMSSQELATAVQYKLPILVIVINNESYGSIRSHQERRFPGRQLGTDLVNPDFVAYAKSFGAHAERVRLTHEFQPAFERARSSGVPAVLEVTSDAAVRLDERDYP